MVRLGVANHPTSKPFFLFKYKFIISEKLLSKNCRNLYEDHVGKAYRSDLLVYFKTIQIFLLEG